MAPPELCAPETPACSDEHAWRRATLRVTLRRPGPMAASTEMAPATKIDFADMLYFSFVSFTTTGYGDIKAVSNEARLFVILQNILEIFFAGVVVASVLLPVKTRCTACGKSLGPAPLPAGA